MIPDRLQMNKSKLIISAHANHVERVTCMSLLWLLACVTVPTIATATENETRGDGLNPAPVIPGDKVALPVPSGLINNGNSTNFGQTYRKLPTIIYLRTDTYSHNPNEPMGMRTVMNINLDTIKNPMTLDLVASVLKLDLSSSKAQNVTFINVNQSQLEQLQKILAPSANDSSSIATLNASGKKYIFQDPPVNNFMSREPWLLSHLPIVKQFSRYAVLLGVVMSTVLFSLAAYGLTMGEKGSSQRILATAAGLIVLLMAFTIYRLLIGNSISISAPDGTVQLTQ